MKGIIGIALLLLTMPAWAPAQDAERPPRGQGYGFLGAGTRGMTPTVGFGGEAYVFKGLGIGAELGVGGLDFGGDPDTMTGLASADGSYHFFPKKVRGHPVPFITGGCTMFFGHNTHEGSGFFGHKPLSTNGFNVRGGVDFFASNHFGLRVDLRYYGHGGRILNYVYPDIQQFSSVAFRIGLTFR